MTTLLIRRSNGRCISTPVVTSKAVLDTPASQPPSHVVHVRLEKLATGCWSVRAAAGNRGGLFRDYASATQFIRHEFAARQPTVVEMLQA
jgi:hypothetical protein